MQNTYNPLLTLAVTSAMAGDTRLLNLVLMNTPSTRASARQFRASTAHYSHRPQGRGRTTRSQPVPRG